MALRSRLELQQFETLNTRRPCNEKGFKVPTFASTHLMRIPYMKYEYP